MFPDVLQASILGASTFPLPLHNCQSRGFLGCAHYTHGFFLSLTPFPLFFSKNKIQMFSSLALGLFWERRREGGGWEAVIIKMREWEKTKTEQKKNARSRWNKAKVSFLGNSLDLDKRTAENAVFTPLVCVSLSLLLPFSVAASPSL